MGPKVLYPFWGEHLLPKFRNVPNWVSVKAEGVCSLPFRVGPVVIMPPDGTTPPATVTRSPELQMLNIWESSLQILMHLRLSSDYHFSAVITTTAFWGAKFIRQEQKAHSYHYLFLLEA